MAELMPLLDEQTIVEDHVTITANATRPVCLGNTACLSWLCSDLIFNSPSGSLALLGLDL